MENSVFGRSRRQLTLFYSLIMFGFLVVMILVVHKTMEWSLSSEQARELLDTAVNVAEAQNSYNQYPGTPFDETNVYKSSNDRLFFYIIDEEGKLLNFSRASFRIESYILDVIDEWSLSDGEVNVYEKPDEKGRMTKVMMTSRSLTHRGMRQTVYVGKDVTAIYNGMQKSTYALIFIGVIALLISSVLGHVMSGKAIVPLRQAYEKQRQFAADASHELRTPLAVVMASAEILLNDPSIQSPFLKQILEDVLDEVKKMSKLVGDLLIVARSDNKALKVNLQKVNLADILSHNIRLMQPLAEKKDITLQGERLLKCELQADEQKLRQLALILVDNAIKYTPEGGKVLVRIEPSENGVVRFSVADTGIGISKEDQEKIFDRFYRVDKARSREMGGNGLGLAIAEEIVNLHNGRIFIESELGEGTKFIVELRSQAK